MRTYLMLAAILLVVFCLTSAADAQCRGGNCPSVQVGVAVAVDLDRPLVRVVTSPVRAVRRVAATPTRRVFRWRPARRWRIR